MARPARRFLIVGHRGAARRAPENTAASLVAGIEAGADAIEIDVGLTRDGRAVLLHDTTLDRTTDGRGALASMTWARAERLDAGSWFDRRFAGEPPIDLDDALAIVRGRVPLIVEVKPTAAERARGVDPRDRETVRAVLAAFRRTGGMGGVTVSSAAWSLLAFARSEDAAVDLALTVRSTERRDPLAVADDLRAASLHPSARLCGREWFGRARDRGLVVIPYTVNRASALRALRALGADGVFTDDPAAMRRALLRDAPAKPGGTLALGIDQGSGGTRAVLLDDAGEVAASRQVRLASRLARDGSIVQDAEAVAASVVRAAGPLVEEASSPVRAAGLAVQRSSIVLWRRSDGRPVTPVLSWRTGAAYEPPAALLRVEERIARATGLTVRFPYGAIRLARLLEREPDLARGLSNGRIVVGPLGAFLAARLTGTAVPCDPSLAQRTLAFDLAHGSFTDELASALGVPSSAWTGVAASTAPRGRLKLGRSRPPLAALLGDVGAAVRAVAQSGCGVLVLGTGGFVAVPTGSRARRIEGLLTTLLWDDGEARAFAVEGTVHGLAAGLVEAGRRGGWERLPAPRIAARSAFARRTPTIVAAVEGTGTPDWEVAPRFVVERGRFAPEEIVRGTIEDLAGRFGRIAALLRGARSLPARFVATGGLAFSPHLVDRIAHRMGVAIEVDPRPDRTAAGAAMIARDAL